MSKPSSCAGPCPHTDTNILIFTLEFLLLMWLLVTGNGILIGPLRSGFTSISVKLPENIICKLYPSYCFLPLPTHFPCLFAKVQNVQLILYKMSSFSAKNMMLNVSDLKICGTNIYQIRNKEMYVSFYRLPYVFYLA